MGLEKLEEVKSDIKKVLIIRTCRMEQFYDDLEILKENLGPSTTYDVLAQSQVKDELINNESINQVLIYDNGFFKVRKITRELWNQIKCNYDAFVILYYGTTWKKYHQVHRIAALSKAKYIIGININEDVFVVPRNLWWLKRLSGFIFAALMKCLKIIIIIFLVILIPIFLLLSLVIKAGVKTKEFIRRITGSIRD